MLNIYSIKDDVAGTFPFIFESPNDGTMVRIVKGAMLDKQPNIMNTDIKDKSVYIVGTRDEKTGVLCQVTPTFIKHLKEVRDELILEIKTAKAECGDPEPKADEVCDE